MTNATTVKIMSGQRSENRMHILQNIFNPYNKVITIQVDEAVAMETVQNISVP